jgi:hypothetical protein
MPVRVCVEVSDRDLNLPTAAGTIDAANRRNMTDAAQRKARAEPMVASKSFASLRLRPIHAKNRLTTQRRGLTAGASLGGAAG